MKHSKKYISYTPTIRQPVTTKMKFGDFGLLKWKNNAGSLMGTSNDLSRVLCEEIFFQYEASRRMILKLSIRLRNNEVLKKKIEQTYNSHLKLITLTTPREVIRGSLKMKR